MAWSCCSSSDFTRSIETRCDRRASIAWKDIPWDCVQEDTRRILSSKDKMGIVALTFLLLARSKIDLIGFGRRRLRWLLDMGFRLQMSYHGISFQQKDGRPEDRTPYFLLYEAIFASELLDLGLSETIHSRSEVNQVLHIRSKGNWRRTPLFGAARTRGRHWYGRIHIQYKHQKHKKHGVDMNQKQKNWTKFRRI